MSDAADSPTEAAPRPTMATAPLRPTLASTVPSPLEGLKPSCPLAVNLSIWLWALSGIAGMVPFGYFANRYPDVQRALTVAVQARDPELEVQSLERVVDRTAAGALGLIIGPIIVGMICVILMGKRRNWGRVLLALVGIAGPPLALTGVVLMTVDTIEAPRWVMAALVAQGALAVGALVAMYLPSANTWFRTRTFTLGL